MSKRFAPIGTVGAGATPPDADVPQQAGSPRTPQEGSTGPQQAQQGHPGATAPRSHDAIDHEPDADADHADDAPGPAGPAARRGRPRIRRAPSVDTARAMTVRMEPEEADAVDRFVLDLRDETGQRFDKAAMVRELLLLAQTDPAVRRKLARRLR